MPCLTPGGVTQLLSPLSLVAAVASLQGVVQPPLALPERPVPRPDGKKEIRSRLVLPWVHRRMNHRWLCSVICLPGVVYRGDVGIPGRI